MSVLSGVARQVQFCRQTYLHSSLKLYRMHTLPYFNQTNSFPHLTAWFRYRSPRSKGFRRLEQLLNESSTLLKAIVTTEADYFPLTNAEEERWKILERKAKQENLSGSDSAEYDILLEVKLYHRFKEQCPHHTHEALVMMVRKAM